MEDGVGAFGGGAFGGWGAGFEQDTDDDGEA